MRLAVLSLLFSGTAYAACPDLEASLVAAEATVLEGRFDDTETALATVETALGCGEVGAAESLARFWITEGAMLHLGGDPEGAVDSFTAARRVAPDYWNADFGPQLATAFQAAAPLEGPSGTIALSPGLERYLAHIDGAPANIPAETTPGLHLIQVGPPEGPTEFAQFVYVPPGQELSLATGIVEKAAPAPEPVVVPEPEPVVAPEPEPEPLPEVPPPPPPQKPKISPFLIGAGVAAVGSAITFGLHQSQNAKYEDAESIEALDATKNRQIAFGGTAIGLAGLAATGVVLHVAF
ncbi:MAG: hypothetical protein KC912_10455 [Proteobacteria bacterium]|nr:hypothetical protein [Pseudomonadota bacterium]